MLVLTRKDYESLIINDNIVITILGIRGGQVKIGITAPKDIPVHRQEVYERIYKKPAPSIHPEGYVIP